MRTREPRGLSSDEFSRTKLIGLSPEPPHANRQHAGIQDALANKHILKRPDFTIRPDVMLNWARERGFFELPMMSEHGLAAGSLRLLHRDPFDRAMIAQAMVEGIVFLTADAGLAAYGDVVRVV